MFKDLLGIKLDFVSNFVVVFIYAVYSHLLAILIKYKFFNVKVDDIRVEFSWMRNRLFDEDVVQVNLCRGDATLQFLHVGWSFAKIIYAYFVKYFFSFLILLIFFIQENYPNIDIVIFSKGGRIYQEKYSV